MPFIADKVFDGGLTILDSDVENLYINSLEPTTFTSASSTDKLGTKASPTVGAPEDGATDGRRVILSAITDGVVDSTGTATHYSWADDSLSLLLLTGALSSSQGVTSGNTFTLDAISATLRDAA